MPPNNMESDLVNSLCSYRPHFFYKNSSWTHERLQCMAQLSSQFVCQSICDLEFEGFNTKTVSTYVQCLMFQSHNCLCSSCIEQYSVVILSSEMRCGS
uniref:Uncharacterized protein n=1 Tax=Anguilla anguilla TaxID=7936 RepID=A0A0E9X5H2_ANGAN